jgi:hypothetical protein
MKYVACLPFLVQDFRNEFMENCKLDIFEVDNTINNIGIMASHNLAIQKMYDDDAEWLIIFSAAIRFGKSGGLDILEFLKTTEHKIVEAKNVYGWHLIAFHRDIINSVGEWDTNFTPYGYDDLDYSNRIQKAFPNSHCKNGGNSYLWCKQKFDVSDTIMGHSIKVGKLTSSPEHEHSIRRYFEFKWGLPPGTGTIEEVYNYPFNDLNNSIAYFPKNDSEKYHISKVKSRVKREIN